MTALTKSIRRDVIPRWRLSNSGNRDFESQPGTTRVREVTVGPQTDVAALLREFDVSRKPFLAAEALSASIALGDHENAFAAASRLSSFDLTSRGALKKQVARLIEGRVGGAAEKPSGADTARGRIRQYKRLVRSYPASAMAWLDLGFAYTAIGQLDAAKEAVLAASSLEPHHRLIARAASRFFVHKGEFDRALYVLGRSNLVKSDPWLLSAHIATSRAGGLSSPLISIGRKMFKDGSKHAHQISELGAALATNELEHGNSKLATKLVQKALISPTENAVAQVAWLEATQKSDFNVTQAVLTLPDAWEARTFEEFEKREWLSSCREAEAWLEDQPFSSRPAIHGSYVAATFMEDYELARRFAEAGHRANPQDPIVANNYVVSLALLGKTSDARRIFDDIDKRVGDRRQFTLAATNGLLLYREGRIQEARDSYDVASTHFSVSGDYRAELLARIYQAREELRLGHKDVAAGLLIPLIDRNPDVSEFDIGQLRKIAGAHLS